MAERTEQRSRDRDVGVDVDTDFGDLTESSEETTESGGIRERLGRDTQRQGIRGRISDRLSSVFSVRTFALTLVLTVVLAFLTGTFVPVVPASSLIGVFAAGFLLGAGSEDSHYVEVGAATLFSGAVTAVLGHLVLSLAGMGVPVLAVGASASGLAGVVGHYFGRDLRAGLTQDI